ncbi:MAG TPA: AAA family ATPase, partial [Candidatus Acidoferrales bacterium]|nr:AAA family ATPase [Candidatus Acidoferrales bacterium]
METGKSSAPRMGGSHSAGNSPTQNGVFAVKGDYWTLGLGRVTFPIKDIKGLSYIQRLLQHPGEEFHSLDLLNIASVDPDLSNTVVDHEDANPVGITVRRGLTGDAGEMLDAQAKHEYKRRLDELKEKLEDQRERGNHERADQIETEIEFVHHELERSMGRGGRDRRTGSNAERARLNVTRAIRAALEKITEQQPALGELLDRSIRTGSFCSYIPVPERPVIWQFSVDGGKATREIPAAEPQHSRSGASFLRIFTKGTRFVGRDAERAMLTHALDQAQRGEGKIILIRGAAGVGKTRIAAEIAAEAAGRGMLAFVGACYDRDDPVPFIPFVEVLEAALAQTRDLAAFRNALGADAPEIARLVPQLRRSFPDIPAPAELPPEQSRRALFNAVTELVARVSHSTPSLFLLDDLQWADEGTLLLLSHIAQFVPALPIMIVGTLRDFEQAPSGQLNRTLDELIRRHLVECITLAGLPESSVAEMLRALSGQEPPHPIVNLFHVDTEGNPFFVEELFSHLVEQGKLLDSAGKFRRDLEIDGIDVPQSLRLVIGRRIARLDDATVKALGTAAVIGRSFTFDLLAAATHMGAEALLDCVEEAERAGLIVATLEYPEARFRFSHELIRQAVVSELSAPRRQRLHLDVADAIEL